MIVLGSSEIARHHQSDNCSCGAMAACLDLQLFRFLKLIVHAGKSACRIHFQHCLFVNAMNFCLPSGFEFLKTRRCPQAQGTGVHLPFSSAECRGAYRSNGEAGTRPQRNAP